VKNASIAKIGNLKIKEKINVIIAIIVRIDKKLRETLISINIENIFLFFV
jgi:hypothetical protein